MMFRHKRSSCWWMVGAKIERQAKLGARLQYRPIRTLLLTVLAASVVACAPELDPVPPSTGLGQTFGEKVFNIICQRVAYTSSQRAHELAELAARDDTSVTVPPIDVSGSRYRLACRLGPDYLPAGAAERDPKVTTLVGARDSFAKAIDIIFPVDELEPLQDYMVRLLPLTDDGTFPDLVRRAGAVLKELEGNTELHAGLARLDGRVGYRPREVYLGLIGALVSYPELQTALAGLLQLIGEGGPAHQAFLDLVEAVAFELRGAQKVSDPRLAQPIKPADPERPLRLGLDLLMSQRSVFAAEAEPVMLVRRDHRGLAAVAKTVEGKVPAPFIDSDGDGFADLDALGRFVTKGGAAPEPFPMDGTAPDSALHRDSEGRALDAQGKPLYEYLDLDQTLLAAVAREGKKLLETGTQHGTQLLLGMTGLLGERRPAAKTIATGEKLSFSGFDTARSPLLDLLYALLQLLRGPHADGTLELATLLLQHRESSLARLVGAVFDAKEMIKSHPEAILDPRSSFYDDLVPLIVKLVNTRKPGAAQGLIEDLIDALADPRARNLEGMLESYFKYRDVVGLDPITQQLTNAEFKQPVDRSQPDTGLNRSILQRLFHLVNNASNVRLCNKEDACLGVQVAGVGDLCAHRFKACELFEVDNGAVFYAQSIARLRDANGNLTDTPKAFIRLKTENIPGWILAAINVVGADVLMQTAFGVPGLTLHPSTEALNRLLFLDPAPANLAQLEDPVRDIEGHEVRSYHAGTLLTWEVVQPQYSCGPNDPCRFLDAFRPIVQAFADHDAEKLLIDIVSVLHKHWPSRASADFQFLDPRAPAFAWGTGLVGWEQWLIELLQQRRLFSSICDLAAVLSDKSLKLADGTPAKTALTRTLQFLFDASHSPGLTYRDGRDYSLASDGKTRVAGGVSPFYLLADAIAGVQAGLASLAGGADGQLAQAWRQSTSDLVDVFLSVEKLADKGGESWRFVDRRLPALAQTLIEFVRARLSRHRTSGDVDHWLGRELPGDVERILSGPVVARAADFLRVLDSQAVTQGALYELGRYFLSELAGSRAFRSTLTSLADLVQLFLDDDDMVPIAQALGRMLNPARGLVAATLRFLKPALAADAGESCLPASPSGSSGQRCLALGSGPNQCSRELLSSVLRNAWKEQSPGKTPVQTLLDLVAELHRLKPGSDTPYSGADFAEAFHQASDFLSNATTGLVKFFDIIKCRDADASCANESSP